MAKPKGKNQELYEATHRRILAVATELFSAYGFEKVTAKQVAEAAGVAQGSVFHHFGTKRDLFIEVHNRYQIAMVEQIDLKASQATTPEDRFDKIWRTYLALTEDTGMRQILLLDGPRVIGLENLRAQDRKTAFAFLMEELEQLRAAGIIAPPSIRGLAVLLFGAFDQAAFEMADFPEDLDLRQALIQSTASLIDSLKVP